MIEKLRERIAEHLGWSVKDTNTFSLASLKPLVTDSKLRAHIDDAIASGATIVGEPLKPKRRWG